MQPMPFAEWRARRPIQSNDIEADRFEYIIEMIPVMAAINASTPKESDNATSPG